MAVDGTGVCGISLTMSPRRVQDLEGAKIDVISFYTVTGAVVAVLKRMFLLTCYTEVDTGRLRLDLALTT
jgi:hypothetical protein